MTTAAQIQTHIREIHDASAPTGHDAAFKSALEPFTKILVLLAEDADKQTRRIVRLTWALIVLTVLLLIFTIYLCEDTYFKSKRDTADHDAAKQSEESYVVPK